VIGLEKASATVSLDPCWVLFLKLFIECKASLMLVSLQQLHIAKIRPSQEPKQTNKAVYFLLQGIWFELDNDECSGNVYSTEALSFRWFASSLLTSCMDIRSSYAVSPNYSLPLSKFI